MATITCETFQPGTRVKLRGWRGEGEVLANHGEGSITVGWEGVGMRVHHWSQLEVVA